MKKIFLSLSVVLTFTFYSLQQKSATSNETNSVVPSNITVTPEVGSIPVTDNQTVTPVLQPVSGKYKDGVYTGNVADAYYGNVQVKVAILKGKITDVQFLDYPHDRRTSVNINSQAMPDLKSEAIQAQNANVDIVSGATATSQAFRESLQSALAQAQS